MEMEGQMLDTPVDVSAQCSLSPLVFIGVPPSSGCAVWFLGYLTREQPDGGSCELVGLGQLTLDFTQEVELFPHHSRLPSLRNGSGPR